MPSFRPTQYSFGSGEISPRLFGRQDKERYYNSLEEMLNYSITHHGAAERSPGSRFVNEVKDSSKRTRLIPFSFSTVQNYIIEVGEFYMRFYKDGGVILDPISGVEIVTNGGFTGNLNNWTDGSYMGGSSALESNAARLTGTIYGPELINNGDFEAGTLSWSNGSGPGGNFTTETINVGFSFNTMGLLIAGHEPGSIGNCFQDFNTTILNTLYHVNFASSGPVGVQLFSAAGVVLQTSFIQSAGQHNVPFIPRTTITRVVFFTLQHPQQVSIDNVSIRGLSAGAVFQDLTTVVDVRYQISFDVLQGGVVMEVTDIATGARLGGDFTAVPGTRTFDFIARGTSTRIYFRSDLGNGVPTGLLDNVTVKATNTPLEIVTPYFEDDLFALDFKQSADTLFITHQKYAPRKLVRTSHINWILSEIAFFSPATEEPPTDLAASLTLSATSGAGVTATAGSSVFLASDVGRTIRGSAGGRASITAFTSGTVVTVDVLDVFPGVNIASGAWFLHGSPNAQLTPQKNAPKLRIITLTLDAAGWRAQDVSRYVFVNGGIVRINSITSATVAIGTIQRALDSATASPSGAWSVEAEAWNGTNGFPKVATFHDSRLYYAASIAKPQTIWASAKDSFEDFGHGTKETEAFAFTIASPLIDVIQWMASNDDLFIGTHGGVERIQGTQGPISPTSIKVRNQSAHGVAFRPPVRVGNSLLYIGRNQTRVYELGLNPDGSTEDIYLSQDISILSDHLGEAAPFEDMSYAQNPWSTIYVRRADGVLCGLGFNKLQNQIGWFRRQLPAGGRVDSIATVPHWTQPYDAVFAIVRVTVNGVVRRYVTFFDRDLNTDLALTRVPTGTKVTSVSGLGHLEGLTVGIVGDGATQIPQKVVSGVVNLSTSADAVEVGLFYPSRMKTLPLATVQQTLSGMKKRVVEIVVGFFKTLTATVNRNVVPFRKPNDKTNQGVPAFTGEVEVTNFQVDKTGAITIEQKEPLPQTVLYVSVKAEVTSL